jgi:hypothetical protein
MDLSFNALSGPIPRELGDLPRLRSLVLCFNDLTGAVPAELLAPARRLHLDVTFNNLDGQLAEGDNLDGQLAQGAKGAEALRGAEFPGDAA